MNLERKYFENFVLEEVKKAKGIGALFVVLSVLSDL